MSASKPVLKRHTPTVAFVPIIDAFHGGGLKESSPEDQHASPKYLIWVKIKIKALPDEKSISAFGNNPN